MTLTFPSLVVTTCSARFSTKKFNVLPIERVATSYYFHTQRQLAGFHDPGRIVWTLNMCPVHRALSAKVRLRSQVSPRLFVVGNVAMGCSEGQRGLRRRSTAAEIVGSNPTGGMSVCHECCVSSGRVLCVGLITRPEKWCVVV